MRVLLDCNIFDLLNEDTKTRDRISSLVSCGALQLLLTRELWRQLIPRFGGAPEWFPEMIFVGAVMVYGHHRKWGDGGCYGDSDVYAPHKGQSLKEGNVGDAILADAAHKNDAAFVTEDKRAYRKFNDLGSAKPAYTYEEFKELLEQLVLRGQFSGDRHS